MSQGVGYEAEPRKGDTIQVGVHVKVVGFWETQKVVRRLDRIRSHAINIPKNSMEVRC